MSDLSFSNGLLNNEKQLSLLESVNSNTEMESSYELSTLWRFSLKYRAIHGWLLSVICTLGLITNMLTIVVLTRANLRRSPTSLILIAIAATDLITMLSTLILVVYFYLIHGSANTSSPVPEPSPQRDTWAWTHFTNAHVILTFISHSISIWLNVYLACFRYIVIVSSAWSSYQQHTRSTNIVRQHENKPLLDTSDIKSRFRRLLLRARTYNFTMAGIVSICVFCAMLSLPAFAYSRVGEFVYSNLTKWDPASNSSRSHVVYVYKVQTSELNQRTNGLIFEIMFYLWAIAGKLIPCALLFVFSSLLVRSLVVIGRKSNHVRYSKADIKMVKFKETTCINVIKKTIIRESISSKEGASEDGDDQRRNSEPAYPHEKKKKKTSFEYDNNKNNNDDDNTTNNENSSKATKEPRNFDKYRPKKKNGVSSMHRNHSAVELPPRQFRRTIKWPSENLRTTLMLIIVCVLFLLSEIIHSVLLLLSIVEGQSFYQNVYLPLGDLLDMITFVTSSIDFVIYCLMSSTFRKTLCSLFIPSSDNHDAAMRRSISKL